MKRNFKTFDEKNILGSNSYTYQIPLVAPKWIFKPVLNMTFYHGVMIGTSFYANLFMLLFCPFNLDVEKTSDLSVFQLNYFQAFQRGFN